MTAAPDLITNAPTAEKPQKDTIKNINIYSKFIYNQELLYIGGRSEKNMPRGVHTN
jgi:hypothetical protein